MTELDFENIQNAFLVNLIDDIEKIRSRSKAHIEYIDAIIHYCEKNNLEIETVAKIIKKNPVLKSKLQDEAEELNIIEKTSKLPL